MQRLRKASSVGTLAVATASGEPREPLLFMANPQPMWAYDLETLRFLEVNAAAVSRYGYTRDEFLSMRISDIRPPEDVPLLLQDLRRNRADLDASDEWRHRLKDGRVIDVEITSHLLEFGGRKAALVVAHDITARKRADRALRFLAQASSVLAGSLDYETTLAQVARLAIPDLADWCAVQVVEDGEIRDIEVAHVDPSKVALARELQQRYPPDPDGPGAPQVIKTGKAELYPEIPDALLQAVAVDAEHLRLTRELGLVSAMAVPLAIQGRTLGVITFVWAESGQRYGPEDLAIAEDLARRCAQAVENARLYRAAQEAEQHIRELNAELEQRVVERTAQLEAAVRELEAFSYSVSHDLRAPLRAIHGFSRILLEEHAAELSQAGRRYLQLVRDNAKQMGQLIDDLLSFSRLTRQPLNKQAVAPRGVVESALQDLSGERDGRRVELKIGDLRPCLADPALLKQVFVNLLSNAFKFTATREQARIEVGSREQDGEIAYFVKDNGVGFDMRYVDRLFTVFQRLHRAEEYEGTGVGLAIVQRIVHRHGGRVWAEGEVDVGATFWFTLGPARPAEVAAP